MSASHLALEEILIGEIEKYEHDDPENDPPVHISFPLPLNSIFQA
jgi:hypothetical protein